VNREAQSVLLLLVGGAVLRISLSDVYLRYVKAGLRPFLIVAGVLLVLIALATLWRELFSARATEPDPATTTAPVPTATPGRAYAADAGHPSGDGRVFGDGDVGEPVDGPAHLPADQTDAGPAISADHDQDHAGPDHTGHNHAHGPAVAWLLVLPVFAIFLIAPPALGSYAASRAGSAAVARPRSDFPPLPAGDPVAVSVLDYATRAIWESGVSLKGRSVRLTGFLSPRPGGGYYLTRIILSCCAADGRPLKIGLTGQVPGGLSADTWVEVTGRYASRTDKDKANNETIAYLTVTGLRTVPAPTQPYEQ
jgi:uncharacterized repeat protein (TIGR03943 family)